MEGRKEGRKRERERELVRIRAGGWVPCPLAACKQEREGGGVRLPTFQQKAKRAREQAREYALQRSGLFVVRHKEDAKSFLVYGRPHSSRAFLLFKPQS